MYFATVQSNTELLVVFKGEDASVNDTVRGLKSYRLCDVLVDAVFKDSVIHDPVTSIPMLHLGNFNKFASPGRCDWETLNPRGLQSKAAENSSGATSSANAFSAAQSSASHPLSSAHA